MPATHAMSAEEFLALPARTDARRLELVDGDIVVNQPRPRHVGIQQRLLRVLWDWTDAGPERGRAWMPLDVRLDDRNVYAPDVHWYRSGRGPSPEDRSSPLPDLAAGVRSASTWQHDIGAKKAAYERAGLRELWLIDTAAGVVLVFRRSRPDASTFDVAVEIPGSGTLTSPQLPGFELPLARLFELDG